MLQVALTGFIKEAAQAKLYASELSREVAQEGIQIHGGYGYTTDFPDRAVLLGRHARRDLRGNQRGAAEHDRRPVADMERPGL
jgi:alkylation response protein AidB-like acyl-CoA dehydrogenase